MTVQVRCVRARRVIQRHRCSSNTRYSEARSERTPQLTLIAMERKRS
jgi:hypothetical protein